MNCLEFRRSVGAQPDLDTEAVRAHVDSCDACARYRQELQQMDRLIHRALNIDVGAEPSARKGGNVSLRRTRYWAAAASFLAAVGLGSFLWIASPSASLAEQVVEHAKEEADALVHSPDRVPASELAAILEKSGLRLKPGSMKVSYAMSCWFRDHYVPHIVVQTENGPVTILVLRHEASRSESETFAEEGFSGVIVPAPEGVLAVLGRGAPVEQAAAHLLSVLEYDS